MSNFQQAAASYFGLPERTVLIPSDPGYLAFHVELTSEALAGIAARMAELAKAGDEKAVAAPFVPSAGTSAMRVEYDRMSFKEKAQYGSFHHYAMHMLRQEAEPAPHPLRAEWDSMMPHQRLHFGSFEAYCDVQIQVEQADDKPLAVRWIAAADLTDEQIRGAMGEHAGKYAIPVDNLTDAQRAAP